MKPIKQYLLEDNDGRTENAWSEDFCRTIEAAAKSYVKELDFKINVEDENDMEFLLNELIYSVLTKSPYNMEESDFMGKNYKKLWRTVYHAFRK